MKWAAHGKGRGLRMMDVEVNPSLIPALEEAGLEFVGMGLEGHAEDVDEGGVTARLEALAKEGKEAELAAQLHAALQDLRVDAPPSPTKASEPFPNAQPLIRMEVCELKGH